MIRVKVFLHPSSGQTPASEIGEMLVWNEQRFPARTYAYRLTKGDGAVVEGSGVRHPGSVRDGTMWDLIRAVLLDANTTGPTPCAKTVAELENRIRGLLRYAAAFEEEFPDGVPATVTERLNDPTFFPELT